MKRTPSVATATLTLIAAGLVGASPASAQQPAAPSGPGPTGCGHSWSNKDAGSGNANWTDPMAKLRTGPHANCSLVSWIPGGTKLYYHCYVVNAAGNTWTHARRAGFETMGWIYDDYLNDGGSTKPC